MVTSSPINVEGASGANDKPCGKASDGTIKINRAANVRQIRVIVMENRVREIIVKHEPAALRGVKR
jgi:hypothetical protein